MLSQEKRVLYVTFLQALLEKVQANALEPEEEGLLEILAVSAATMALSESGFVFAAVLVGGERAEMTMICSDDVSASDHYEASGRLHRLSTDLGAIAATLQTRRGDHTGHGCALDPTLPKASDVDEN